jgi:hypothetical protein
MLDSVAKQSITAIAEQHRESASLAQALLDPESINSGRPGLTETTGGCIDWTPLLVKQALRQAVVCFSIHASRFVAHAIVIKDAATSSVPT